MKIKCLQVVFALTFILVFAGCVTAQQSSVGVEAAHEQEARRYLNQGRQALANGDIDAAIQGYNDAIAMYWVFPEEELAQIYVERAVSLMGDAQYDRAMDDLDWAVEWDPTNAKAYYERGSLKIMLAQDPKAGIDDIRQALKLEPQNEKYQEALEYLTAKMQESE
jgi:Tfp pilus assembly protein PilF